ncbi:uncharacterized protein LOC119401432 isoform X4 [Rhipicephalus sanguineus]|uniref:uncharacterized protein LOC119401432 isoform X4 n=1 Tax=Rhipicephalus sanguineus TaxID=34632 RepID=UPI00189366DA|nr:uncharacterized protein LOC119401432 isoform X4 [Rhipicephalus sanguineus]
MRSVETLGILMPPSVTSGSGISCGGQRTRDRMLQEGQQTQSMVPAFSWAAFFLNIGETTTCQPFSMQTPAGLTVSPGAQDYIHSDVHYTCELGICDTKNDCIPSDLFMPCWKPSKPAITKGWLPRPTSACFR